VVVDRANLVLRRVRSSALPADGAAAPSGDERVRPVLRPGNLGPTGQDGRPIEVRSVREAIANGIAYVTEDRKRYDST